MLKIGAIVWGVPDIDRAVKFWSQALDYVPKYPPEYDFAILVPRQGDGFQLSFNLVTSLHPRRHHMDLFTSDQAGEVKRLISLGARRKSWDYEEGAEYVVLEDPDGNPFCVIQLPEEVEIKTNQIIKAYHPNEENQMIEKVYNMSTRTEYVIEPVIKDQYVYYMHMVLLKDQALPTHSTNANIYMTVVSGTMHISLDDGEFRVYPSGSVINIPYNVKMIAQNRGDETLELIVVKTPAPGNEIYK